MARWCTSRTEIKTCNACRSGIKKGEKCWQEHPWFYCEKCGQKRHLLKIDKDENEEIENLYENSLAKEQEKIRAALINEQVGRFLAREGGQYKKSPEPEQFAVFLELLTWHGLTG